MPSIDEHPDASPATTLVELTGGPRDGHRVTASPDAVTLLLHDVPVHGSLTAYCRTDESTGDGLSLFSWLGTAPPH